MFLEEFIKRANQIHNNKYDYSLVEYKNSQTKVKIICPEHGVFEQLPNNHINYKNGCPKCSQKNRKKTIEQFIKEANQIHNNKYDYSLVDYKTNKSKIKIICPIHGVFEQRASHHLNGCGCPTCAGIKRKTTEQFIKRAKEIHGNKYDYSLVEYKNNCTKIKIICPEHGVFEQVPSSHLNGRGCLKCAGKNLTTEEFINKAREIHSDKYDYSKTEYVNSKTKVEIICPIHGMFKITPDSHLNGKQGCKLCNESHGEKQIAKILEKEGYILNETYFREYRFKNCKDKNLLPFDFYVPSKNLLIEYQGIQHYKPVEAFGGVEAFETLTKHDKIKENFCKQNNINLITINYKEKIIKDLLKVN